MEESLQMIDDKINLATQNFGTDVSRDCETFIKLTKLKEQQKVIMRYTCSGSYKTSEKMSTTVLLPLPWQ
jgi:hypothetical protein